MLDAVRLILVREPAARRRRARVHDPRGDGLPGGGGVRRGVAHARGRDSSTTTRPRSATSSSPRRSNAPSTSSSAAAPPTRASTPRRDARRSKRPARAIADLRLGRLDDRDDGEHRQDRRRQRPKRRPGALLARRGGPLARRGEARRARPGDARRVRVRRSRDGLRGRDPGDASCTAATASTRTISALGLARRGARAEQASSRARSRSGAGRTPTSSDARGIPCVVLANGMAADPRPAGAHRRRRPGGHGRRHAGAIVDLARVRRECRLASAAGG